ncbi:sulfur carrier protein ThiS [Chengkuizengella axinellae]|uniref:Sulfur carrier protein ThiS n=1 Tax=Chengkuizengella axinellae TaxID=3064388 RepID=A0ABT9J173_9BACL|nr:sulfur carrier protein ThiS [Chengkuizengella sp. 2205SS18-9]MDP5274754.1 sulfur carrier protein ThiS [Chengkuizengella sp. 2205SS18-9]
MKLHINGESVEVPNSVDSVTELLTHFQLQDKVVIVELNKHILEKENHALTTVTDGDRIEIVHFVGGG